MQDLWGEIRGADGRALHDANSITAGESSLDVDAHLLSTAHYFIALAAQLLASGLDETAGAGGVAHRIEEEARRLRRLAGGSYGSSGSSAGT